MKQSQVEIQKNFYDKEFRTIATKKIENNIRNFYFQKIITIISKNVNIKGNGKILEIGIGEGIIMKKMTDYFKKCTLKGIDISEKNIEIAKEKGLNVEVGDANNLNLSEKYDLIYGSAIIHHLEDIPKFFEDVTRILNKNGVILFGPEPVLYEFFYTIYHKLRGDWEIEKGMLKISSAKIKHYLGGSYKNIKIYNHGNAFIYFSNFIGKIYNISGLSKIPFLNDIYIYAEKN